MPRRAVRCRVWFGRARGYCTSLAGWPTGRPGGPPPRMKTKPALRRDDILKTFAESPRPTGDHTMKSTTLITLSLLAVSAGAFAQSPEIDKALLAAPGQLKAGATVIKWKPDFT